MSAFFMGASQAQDCPADRIDERVLVEWVVDGDTVRLPDKRSVRLIGLDAPEAARDQRPAEPFADEATAALRGLLRKHADRIDLRYGREPKDRHGRSLAHVFLPDGTSTTAHVLRSGLATSLVIPPNIWNSDCYLNAEREARDARRGLWNLPRYQPVASSALPPSTRGFRIVRGRVTRIGESRRAIWINLEGGFAAKIEREDLRYFDAMDWGDLVSRSAELRGWIYAHRGELRVRLRHPSALQLLD